MANWLEKFFTTPAPEAKSLDINRDFVTELVGPRSLRAPATDNASLQEAVTRNELIFACLDVKATSAQDPRLMVQRQVTTRGKTTYEEVAGHPLRQLLMRPNPSMTESDLMRAAVVSWDISNPRRFYCEKTYTSGLLTELHPLDPAMMTPLRSATNGDTIGYRWGSGGNRKDYSLDDLLIRSAPAWYAPPPLPAALGAESSDSAQTAYTRAFFANGGTPSGLLKYNRPLNQPERDEIREKWSGIYGNRYGGQHGIGVLDSQVEYQKTGSNLDELSSQVLRSVAESRICMVFKVPPIIVYAYVGLLRATYSNLKEAWAGFWDATMSPQFAEWRTFWLWSLLPEFEEERDIRREFVRLQYDMSNVSALQDDVDGIHKRARDDYQAGGLSFNEYRSAIGRDAVPGGDDLYVAKPMSSIASMTMLPTMPPAPVQTPPKARKARSDPGVQVIERRMQQALKAYLLAEYAKGGLSGLDSGPAIAKIMAAFYPLLLERAFDDANREGVSVTFDLAMAEVQDVLGSLAKQIVNVTDTTRDEVARLVGLQAENGWSTADLAREIRQLGETRSATRALVIARTETGTAYNLGAITAYKAGGVTHVQVLDGDDDEPCASANGSIWTLEQAEANPLGHPNCQRAFAPIVT